MGDIDGSVSKLWQHEFKKSGIEYDEIVLIGNNLGELDKPEFIPNVFQLIGIVKKIKDNHEVKIAHERISRGLPKLMSRGQVIELRDRTKQVRDKSFKEIKNILI